MSKKGKRDLDTIAMVCRDENEVDTALAQTYLRPSVQSAGIIRAIHPDDTGPNINNIISELNKQVQSVHDGDLKRVEEMLLAQAHSLDALFTLYFKKAMKAQYTDQLKAYTNIGLRAQSQCRATLEAIGEIKNPRPYIQNNKSEYQQINNGVQPQNQKKQTPDTSLHAHAGENSKSTNKLLENKQHENEWLDIRTPQATIGNDKELETVGKKHRTKN